MGFLCYPHSLYKTYSSLRPKGNRTGVGTGKEEGREGTEKKGKGRGGEGEVHQCAYDLHSVE
jgi:hypothetical protein